MVSHHRKPSSCTTMSRSSTRSSPLVGLLIASHSAGGHDEGVAGVVHASLDVVIHGEAAGGRLSPQLLVHLLGQNLGHVVVVLSQVWELLVQLELHLVIVVHVLCHGCTPHSVCLKEKRKGNSSWDQSCSPKANV